MAYPIHHLPVLQNWDCHVCGTCCKEYLVTITDDEKKRIEEQSWDSDKDLGGYEPFKQIGPFWRRRSRFCRRWKRRHSQHRRRRPGRGRVDNTACTDRRRRRRMLGENH